MIVTRPAAPATTFRRCLQRFRRNRLASAGLVVVALLVIAAVGAPGWRPPIPPSRV